MRALVAAFLGVLALSPAAAQPRPGLTMRIVGAPVAAASNPEGCDVHESPDAPARAVRLADGSVQLYATDQVNQLLAGPDLLQLRQRCPVVFRGAGDDDPAAFDDRSWLASPWTADGQTIWAIVHDEFHGHLRRSLCPTGRYMDCWYNTLNPAVSTDAGRHFSRVPGLVAALPYRFDEVGLGHHGYFNPTNLISRDGALYMFAFATWSKQQAEGNCLMRTDRIGDPGAWRAWDGAGFGVRFVDPYRERVDPARHVCAPVDPAHLRWPMTSLVRHRPSGLYVALMHDARRGGGIYAATSPDLLHWSEPNRLAEAIGVGAWACGDPPPVAYPALLDPASEDRNFETVGDTAQLYLTEFAVDGCRSTQRRRLIRLPFKFLSN